MNLTGSRIGKLRIDHLIAKGGMGEVYAAFDETLGRRVAVKVIREKHRIEPRLRARFMREAQALSQIDHPNISRIFDYVEGSDVDLLVMEFIEGRTLRRAVQQGLDFRTKVRIAEAVASVLVAAHRHGIVHRDLKPDNVMLTPEGEVKVLDFGLVRFMRGAPGESSHGSESHGEEEVSDSDVTAILPDELSGIEEERTGAPTESVPAMPATPPRRVTPWSSPVASVEATMQGSAVGTPRYMSPEQARGEPATTASDMYAFGLVLVHLFTGKDPYEGLDDTKLIMARVASGEAIPVKGIDSDVAALVVSLLRAARSDRPTAAEALRRVRSIADRPRRRARVALAVAATMVVVLAGLKYAWDLRAEQRIARAAQEEAQRRRADAEELIGFMLGDLREKLEPLGRLDILDAAGVKALEYYDSLDPDALTPEELGRNAKALYQLGEVRTTQGKLAEAAAAFERSLRLARRAAERDPSNGELQLELGAAEFYAGNAFRLHGDLAKARHHFENYLEVAESLARREPSSETYQVERAYARNNLGVLDESEGAYQEALRHYEVSLEIRKELLSDKPGDFALRDELASAENKIGVVQLKSGLTEEAIATFGREVAILRSLLEEQPDHKRVTQTLATALDYLASAKMHAGDYDGALAELDEVIRIRGELVALDPSNVRWLRNASVPYLWRGDMERSRGRPARALEEYGNSRDRLERAAALSPDRVDWKRDLGQLSAREAGALLDAGRITEAMARSDAAIAELSPLAEKDMASRTFLARARLAKGEVHAASGRMPDAKVEWLEALRLLSESAMANDARARDLKAQVLLRLGEAREAGQLIESLDVSRYSSPELRRLRQTMNL